MKFGGGDFAASSKLEEFLRFKEFPNSWNSADLVDKILVVTMPETTTIEPPKRILSASVTAKHLRVSRPTFSKYERRGVFQPDLRKLLISCT
jgi:hypothetical protein